MIEDYYAVNLWTGEIIEVTSTCYHGAVNKHSGETRQVDYMGVHDCLAYIAIAGYPAVMFGLRSQAEKLAASLKAYAS